MGLADVFAREAATAAAPAPLDIRVAQAEARRITGLPPLQVLRDVTALFKKPRGTMSLRPVQAQALLEIMQHGKLFGPIGVGHGKTLISLLAGPALRKSTTLNNPPRLGRTILLVPAKLAKKTLEEMHDIYEKHWLFDIPTVVSYETLSGSANSDLLERHAPDLIVCDEAHRVAGDSARSRRFFRYLKENPHVRVIPLSGSFTRDSLSEYWKLVKLSLHELSPMPLDYPVFKAWDAVLSTKEFFKDNDRDGIIPFLQTSSVRRRAATAVEMDDFRDVARQAFLNRIENTASWVSAEGASTDARLTLQSTPFDLPEEVRAAIHDVEEHWRRPDGEEFEDSLAKWRYTWQLYQGYYMYWDWSTWPNGEPDREWMAYRAAFHKQIRAFLKDPRLAITGRDSPKNVVKEIRNGRISRPLDLLDAYANWEEVRHRPVPPSKSMWMSNHMIKAIREYVDRVDEPTLIWVDSPLLRDKLSRWFTVYGPGMKPNENKPETCVLGHRIHNEGLNLQKWRRSLLTTLPTNNKDFQQIIGRTWRQGQQDPVQVDYFNASGVTIVDEVVLTLQASARYTQDTTGQTQAALQATWR
jgi:hypothetical protein